MFGLPTWTGCNKLWVNAKHAQNVNHMANTWIRALRLVDLITLPSLLIIFGGSFLVFTKKVRALGDIKLAPPLVLYVSGFMTMVELFTPPGLGIMGKLLVLCLLHVILVLLVINLGTVSNFCVGINFCILLGIKPVMCTMLPGKSCLRLIGKVSGKRPIWFRPTGLLFVGLP